MAPYCLLSETIIFRYFCRTIDLLMDQGTIIILTISVLAGGAILFRRWYLSQARSYKVSEQWHNTYRITITEHNPRHETAVIEIGLSPSETSFSADRFLVEFISKKRELNRKTLPELGIEDVDISYNAHNKLLKCTFEKRDLMRGIRLNDINLYRFRFVVLLTNTSIFKSPEFAFSSKSMLFRPDTGKYN